MDPLATPRNPPARAPEAGSTADTLARLDRKFQENELPAERLLGHTCAPAPPSGVWESAEAKLAQLAEPGATNPP
jgi:hypothetical protein